MALEKKKSRASTTTARRTSRTPVKKRTTARLSQHMVKNVLHKTSSSSSSSAASLLSSNERKKKASEKRERLITLLTETDELLDVAPKFPLTVSEILSDKLNHRTFVRESKVHEYDWSALRTELESRSSNSPRWFMQIREEELLLGPDGFDGVVVDCVVIAETSEPTLSPSEYIVKQHYPYSDLEDNTPERILPLSGQGMCWRRVVRDDGADINAFLLQRRTDTVRAESSTAAAAVAVSSTKHETNNSSENDENNKNENTTKITVAQNNGVALDAASFGFGQSNSTINNHGKHIANEINFSSNITGSCNNIYTPKNNLTNVISGDAVATTTFHSFGFSAVESGAAAPPVAANASLPSAAMFGFGNATSDASTTVLQNNMINKLEQEPQSIISSSTFGFGQVNSDKSASASGHQTSNFVVSNNEKHVDNKERSEELEEEEEQQQQEEEEEQTKDAKNALGTHYSGNVNHKAAITEAAAITVEPLKTSSILFALETKKRLQMMANEINSGSRLVRKDFVLDERGNKHVNLVMQNDHKDNIKSTVKSIILNKMFAKQDKSVIQIDDWIEKCPTYDETLVTALQRFREFFLKKRASESDTYTTLYDNYHTAMENELKRVVAIRKCAAANELYMINNILERIRKHYLAEKSSFRLLKYYASNDIQPFRPFGKISGISEMGEMVDVCVPPAHVNVNPFTMSVSKEEQ